MMGQGNVGQQQRQMYNMAFGTFGRPAGLSAIAQSPSDQAQMYSNLQGIAANVNPMATAQGRAGYGATAGIRLRQPGARRRRIIGGGGPALQRPDVARDAPARLRGHPPGGHGTAEPAPDGPGHADHAPAVVRQGQRQPGHAERRPGQQRAAAAQPPGARDWTRPPWVRPCRCTTSSSSRASGRPRPRRC